MESKIEKSLCVIGLPLGIKKEQIKQILKHRKGLLTIVSIILAVIIAGHLSSVCLRYAPSAPQDFAIFNRFPFSLLF